MNGNYSSNLITNEKGKFFALESFKNIYVKAFRSPKGPDLSERQFYELVFLLKKPSEDFGDVFLKKNRNPEIGSRIINLCLLSFKNLKFSLRNLISELLIKKR